MKRGLLLWLLLTSAAWAHTVEHDVSRREAVVVTTRLGEEEASYAEYEVYAPGQSADQDNPAQMGRTDAHGRLCFLPDQPGEWTVKVKADSQHGVHGFEAKIQVDEKGVVKALSQPLVATHTRLLIGVSLLFGVFGLLSMARGSRSGCQPVPPK